MAAKPSDKVIKSTETRSNESIVDVPTKQHVPSAREFIIVKFYFNWAIKNNSNDLIIEILNEFNFILFFYHN